MKYLVDFVPRLVRAVAWLKRKPEEVRFGALTLLVAGQAYLPIRLLLAALRCVPGVVEQPDAIHLGTLGYAVLASLALVTCLLSVAIGAIHRIVVPSLTTPMAIASYLVGATGFLAGGLLLRPVADVAGDIARGDGGLILMFVAFWIATMGYIAKVAWDDLRDRLVKTLEPATAKPAVVCCRQSTTETSDEATPPVGGAGL